MLGLGTYAQLADWVRHHSLDKVILQHACHTALGVLLPQVSLMAEEHGVLCDLNLPGRCTRRRRGALAEWHTHDRRV